MRFLLAVLFVACVSRTHALSLRMSANSPRDYSPSGAYKKPKDFPPSYTGGRDYSPSGYYKRRLTTTWSPGTAVIAPPPQSPLAPAPASAPAPEPAPVPTSKQAPPLSQRDPPPPPSKSRPPATTTFHATLPADALERRQALKTQLFALAAACDRGFGASTKERDAIAAVIERLQLLSPEAEPTRGLFPHNDDATDTAPLEGVWRMVYTSAFDVLSLAASPLTIVQGVYQVIRRDGKVVNVIDQCPRPQALFPVQLQRFGLAATLRAKVLISGRARSGTRVGLTFLGARLQPTVLPFPFNVIVADPKRLPAVGVNFPRPTQFLKRRFGADSEKLSDPGFFDVLYLDEDTQIIRQNEVEGISGIFVSVRSEEPIEAFM